MHSERERERERVRERERGRQTDRKTDKNRTLYTQADRQTDACENSNT